MWMITRLSIMCRATYATSADWGVGSSDGEPIRVPSSRCSIHHRPPSSTMAKAGSRDSRSAPMGADFGPQTTIVSPAGGSVRSGSIW